MKNIIMVLLMAFFMAGCASVDIDPYKIGKTAYGVVHVSAKDKDRNKIDSVVADIAVYIHKNESADKSTDILIDALLKYLSAKYDPAVVLLVHDTVSLYWSDIEKAYNKGKLAIVAKDGKIIKKLHYLKEFFRGIIDQQALIRKLNDERKD